MDGESGSQVVFLLLLPLFLIFFAYLSGLVLVIAAILGVPFFVTEVSFIDPSFDLHFLFVQDELVSFFSANTLDKMVLSSRFYTLG